MERFFHIEDIDSDRLLVIILSTELTSVYWKDLLDTFQRNMWRNRTVYFDFLYRNGYENRFFSAFLNDESRLMGRLHKCEMESTFDCMSRRYFARHADLLVDSILTKAQIEGLLDAL
jgi:hypothetical protein